MISSPRLRLSVGMGNAAQCGKCWHLFAQQYSHRICDPAQDAPFVASTMTISKGFGWEVHLEIDFKQNVQLGIFLLCFSAEKQQGIQYKTPLRKISSWTNCASIFYDQFLPANISVKMNEEAINGALWTATKYHSHSRPKAEIRWANRYLMASSRLPRGISRSSSFLRYPNTPQVPSSEYLSSIWHWKYINVCVIGLRTPDIPFLSF